MVLAVKTRLFFLFLALCASLSARPLSLSVEAKSAILIDADSGAILYEKDAHSFRYPASTTKIATALYAIKKKGSSLNELVTAQAESIASIPAAKRVQSNYRLPAYWIEKGGSHIGIKSGEKLPFRSLLEGMLIASGNDAANVVAQFTSGTIPQFMLELNTYLKSLGCSKTRLINPHGHHDPEHRTTAYELALITKEALKLPLFCSIVSMKRMSRPKTNLQEAVKLVQTNRLIKQGPHYYPKAFGVKTGTGSHAKCALVAAARDGGRTLIAVLLECAEKKEAYRDAVRLFEAAFSEKKRSRLYPKKGALFSRSIGGKELSCVPMRQCALESYPSEEPTFRARISWYSLSLPIKKGEALGELLIEDGAGKALEKIPLISLDELSSSKFASRLFQAALVLGGALLLLVAFKRFK